MATDEFLADYPFKLFIPEEPEPEQTFAEVHKLMQKSETKKVRIRARNLRNQANGGFQWKEPKLSAVKSVER
jgi:hypothetical protein